MRKKHQVFMEKPALSWWTWCFTEAEKPVSPVKFITSLSKTLSFGFELYALGAAKGWITVIHISSAFFSHSCSRKEKSGKKKKCQNQLINMVIMINMKDYVCLIDPSFINPRKYCYWRVLPFPAGSAKVLREMLLAKGISWCPHLHTEVSAYRPGHPLVSSSKFLDCTLDVKASAKAAAFSPFSKALLHSCSSCTSAEDIVLARIRWAQVVT